MTDITENLSDEDKADYDRIVKRQWSKYLEKKDKLDKIYSKLTGRLVIKFKKSTMAEWEAHLKQGEDHERHYRNYEPVFRECTRNAGNRIGCH